ncbi:MAG: phosphoribosylformylglycinamidine synthase [Spirochaetaceae bacterium]|nr:MAG: phosphoribosylformylglycinamidine synthase [Spirochaetaceae bacterium]
MRIEVGYRDEFPDGRALRLAARLKRAGVASLQRITLCDVYLLSGYADPGNAVLREVFCDSVVQDFWVQRSDDQPRPHSADWNAVIEVTRKPGVTDPVGITAADALRRAGVVSLPERPVDAAGDGSRAAAVPSAVQSARQYRLVVDGSPDRQLETAQQVAAALHNPLIERAVVLAPYVGAAAAALPLAYSNRIAASPAEVLTFDLASMQPHQLMQLSRDRLLSLEPPEMGAIRDYYADPATTASRRAAGLPAGCTDVELEMIAQTWSEHCKHKIFQAHIEYREDGDDQSAPQHIDGLFDTYIRRVTQSVAAGRDDLKSVFHDNAGVVAFDDRTYVCFKAETHNSPSALDPYGGAITGIVGVNRDILGTGKGAKPIFNTNVLCFGELDTPVEAIPQGLMHPRRVLDGVHHGIVDGGNQSGIPTIAGAVLFDDSYVGKPLVFCGTGGILPARIDNEESWIKHIEPGHLAVMVGGRIGKDGIHGATFSSLALDEASPVSAVQIGDPITQRNMTDFLLEARDRGLYAGITDNGAGGLSSSLGEMAQHSGGVRIELDCCPLKYPGLAPWEILVSESQERMSLAVDPAHIQELISLAAARNVEATVVGRFSDSGAVEVFYHDRPVARLDLGFLHDGLPRMQLTARWRSPRAAAPCPAAPGPSARLVTDDRETLLQLLGEPNIASKEALVRQYDHEVQAGSVIKPFVGVGADAPSDGAVVRPRSGSNRALTVTHGICPRYGDADTYHMAMCAVDEAFRAHIALGGDPERAYALDNFCWPDPVLSEDTPDGPYKLAQLVRACRGLHDACVAYGLPLISGKDSMKNDARLAGRKVSVRPTLLISLMGVIKDASRARSTDFVAAGDHIYLLGATRGELGGTSLEKLLQRAGVAAHLGAPPTVDPRSALALYRALHAAIDDGLVASCHDLSDGGLAVALAESALGGRLGARVDIQTVVTSLPATDGASVQPGLPAVTRALFCETPSRFLASVAPVQQREFEAALAGHTCVLLGRVVEQPVLQVRNGSELRLELGLEQARDAFGRLNGEIV